MSGLDGDPSPGDTVEMSDEALFARVFGQPVEEMKASEIMRPVLLTFDKCLRSVSHHNPAERWGGSSEGASSTAIRYAKELYTLVVAAGPFLQEDIGFLTRAATDINVSSLQFLIIHIRSGGYPQITESQLSVLEGKVHKKQG